MQGCKFIPVYVHIYTCMYVCIYIHLYIYVYIYLECHGEKHTNTFMFANIQIYIHMQGCKLIPAYIHIYACMYASIHVHPYIYIYAYTLNAMVKKVHKHLCLRIYTYTYIYRVASSFPISTESRRMKPNWMLWLKNANWVSCFSNSMCMPYPKMIWWLPSGILRYTCDSMYGCNWLYILQHTATKKLNLTTRQLILSYRVAKTHRMP